ncbi:MAG TPA: GNAT family N-acetyltransferase [Candidatus Limiplasma sp.]|nr:GNAT family N-acetyltransferase [Candidatus Limiplasma sp.]HRX08300.1 GNAT family N-acetyltransferase [Candidatus Limiplasma sp.]
MIVPMSGAYAKQISGWTYDSEYAVYSFSQTEETLAELLGGAYYAYLDGHGTLAGFLCFGQAARIPTAEKYPYAPDALDMGLGLKPELCGQGLGGALVQAGIAFAEKTFAPARLRLSVAVSNLRAVRVYEETGFRYEASVTHKHTRKLFYIMLRPCGPGSVQ